MTKKITAVFLVTITCMLAANGQIARHSTLAGGQVFYSNSKIQYSSVFPAQKDSRTAITLSVGKALKENSVYGFNLTYQPVADKNFFNGSTFINFKSNEYDIGIFNRQYKKLITDLYAFVETGIAYVTIRNSSKDTLGNALETVKVSGGQLNITPGLSYRLIKKLHVEITIPNLVLMQYAISKDITPQLSAKQHQFLLTSSLSSTNITSLAVGFHFIL